MAGSEALEVSLRLVLEEQAEMARALAAAGGKAGDEFYKALSPKAQKAFDSITDQAEKAAKEVGAKFSKTELRFRSSSGQFLSPQDLDALTKANAKFAEAQKAVEAFRNAIIETGQESTKSFNLLESAITGVAVSLTSRLTDAVGTALASVQGLVSGFLELDGELRLAAAAAGEQGGYERLAAVVDKVGIEAAGTTKQVAELATSLVRAGFSIKEVEAALPGVVKGAEATGTSFAAFGDIVGNTLRGFGLEVSETSRVVDVLVNTANSSNASIEGLGYTFEYTAPIAKALGVSLEEVAAAAGLMANAGIQGSVAGTGLRTGLQKLQQAAGGASPEVMGLMRGQERLTNVMRKLGATVVDTNGKLLPFDQVLIRLKSGLEKLNQADQVQLANVLFGDEAGSKFLAILNQSDAAIIKLFGDIKNSSGAADTARTAMAGMGLELQQLQGTMDSLGTAIGSVMAAGLRPLVGLANVAVGAISALPAPAKAAGGAIVALGLASVGAAVAVGALNLVVGQIGGYAVLKAALASTIASFGPIAAGTTIVLGLAAAIGYAASGFRETDKTTKALIQTTVGLAVGVSVFRGIAGAVALLNAAQALWNTRLKGSIALQTVLTALTPKGLVQLAVAATAATAAYAAVGSLIRVAGEETEDLSGKTEELRDEIKLLQEEIQKRKELKLDTTEAQKKLDNLQLDLQQLQAPLEIKLDIQRIDSQIQSLQDKINKNGGLDPANAALQAKIDAFKGIRDELIAAEKGTGSAQFENLTNYSKEFVRKYEAGLKEIDKLNRQKLSLPGDATDDRNRINKRISDIQSGFDRSSERRRLEAEGSQIQRQIALNKERIKDAEKLASVRKATAGSGLGPDDVGGGSINSSVDAAERMNSLQKTAQRLRQAEVNNKEAIVKAANNELRAAKSLSESAKEKLEIEKTKLETLEASASLTDKIKDKEASRLGIIREIADAYSGLASAQADLVQSRFDVDSSRNGRDIAVAEKDLQVMKERGESANVIKAAEERIAQLKRDSEVIEFRAMEAAIKSTQQRFDIESAILRLKQRSQYLEQEGAVRAAKQGTIGQEQKMLDLRGKLLDPSLSPGQKTQVAEQIKLQEESIGLSKEQEKFEKERLKNMNLIFGIERKTLEAQQQTTANKQRASAASKGFEEALNPQLFALDEAAGIKYKTVRKLVGQIQEAGKPVQNMYEDTLQVVDSTDDIAKGWEKVRSAIDGATKAVKGNATENATAIKSAKDLVSTISDPGRISGKLQSPPLMGSAGRRLLENKSIVDNLVAAALKDKMKNSYAYSSEGLSFMAGDTEAGWSKKGTNPSWFGDEELSGMKRIEKATKMTADEFFNASNQATYLERTLKALGKDPGNIEEKMKWYARAMSQATQNNGSLEFSNKLLGPLGGGPQPPSDFDKQSRAMANKGWLGAFDTFGGMEGPIDKLAAELADADAAAKNLKGSIDGVRDSVGNLVIPEIDGPISGKNFAKLNQELRDGVPKLQDYKNLVEQVNRGRESFFGVNGNTGDIENGQTQVNDGLDTALEKTKDLYESWENVHDAIINSADALKVYSEPPTARWAGGWLDAGQTADTINELGTESFLSRSGVLSLIRAPAYSSWTAPSPGMVLPAGLTSRLDSMGAFDRGSSRVGPALAGAMPLSPGVGGGFTGVADRLERRMASLEDAMRSYRPMNVQVDVPSNAGQLHTLMSFR